MSTQILTAIINSSLDLCTGNIGSSIVLHAPLIRTDDSLEVWIEYLFKAPYKALRSYLISDIPISHSFVQKYSIPILQTWAGY